MGAVEGVGMCWESGWERLRVLECVGRVVVGVGTAVEGVGVCWEGWLGGWLWVLERRLRVLECVGRGGWERLRVLECVGRVVVGVGVCWDGGCGC